MRKFIINPAYSYELNNVIGYAEDVLTGEYPTNTLTVQYLILAILNVNNCHANMILDSCLISSHMLNLRKAYESVLREHSMDDSIGAESEKSDRFKKLLNEDSVAECNKSNSKETGTEHVLLAILNPDNDYHEGEIFKKFGIEYDFIFNKCMQANVSKTQTDVTVPPKVNVMASGKYQMIEAFTENVTKKYRQGKIDEVVGRDDKIAEIVKILSRKKKNNVIIVGQGGCGKTSMVNGLVGMIENKVVPQSIEGKEIIKLNIPKIIGGTSLRGMFEERVNGLFTELKNSKKYILFIDDIQNVLKSSSKDKDGDMSGMLGDILDDENVKIIATCSFKDYKNCIEINSSLSRKFQKIVIESTTIPETISILERIKWKYEEYHHVIYDIQVIKRAVELAERYITDRALPDSAIDVIDLAGASASIKANEDPELNTLKQRIIEIGKEKERALNEGNFEYVNSLMSEENVLTSEMSEIKRFKTKNDENIINITVDDIMSAVSEMTGIPVKNLRSNEKQRIANIDKVLKQSVVGQDEAVDTICRVIKRNKVGLGDKTKTLSNILMVGPSGCGKCVTKDTTIRIRNKKTLEIETLTIEEFKNRISKQD